MGTSINTFTLIIAKQPDIEKLFCTLEALPERMFEGKMQKFFLDNPNYAEKAGKYGGGHFSKDDVFIGNAKNLDDSLTDFHYLYVKSSGWNCEWDSSTFMRYNNIAHEWLAIESWNDSEPYANQYYIKNESTEHYEGITLVDPEVDDGPRSKSKPGELLSFGIDLLATLRGLKDKEAFKQRNEIYKHRLVTEIALKQLE